MTHRNTLLTWITLAALLMVAAGLRLATVDRFLPYMDYSDESNMFLLAVDMRGDEVPLAADYGAPLPGAWLDGYPPLFPWLSVWGQRLLEATTDRFLFPYDYIGAMRAPTLIANVLTVAIMFALGVSVATEAGPRWATLTGGLAALPYAISAPIVDVGNLAIPDSFIPLGCAVALFGAVRAITQDKPLWLVWSLLGAIAAIYLKYSVLVGLLATGYAVIVLIRRQGWRVMLPWLVLLAAISAITAGYLIWGYGALGLENREASNFRETGLVYMFDLQRNRINLLTAIDISLGSWPLLGGLVLGGAALIRRRAGWLALLVPFVIANILMTSSIVYASPELGGYGRIRFVFPAALGLSVLWALAVCDGARWLAGRSGWLAAAIAGGLALAVILPAIPANVQQIRHYATTDTNLILWRYSDASLPNDGRILTPRFSRTHVVWNRPYSGYDGKTFRWAHNETPYTFDPAATHAEGIHYFVYTAVDRAERLNTPAMDDWLGQLYLLKTIATRPAYVSGETTYIYRMTPPQQQLSVPFGDRIQLVGYDLSATTLEPGDNLQVRPYWQAAAPPAVNYAMSVQLSAPDGSLIAQQDGPPVTDARLPLTWDDPDERLIGAQATLMIPPQAAPGAYTLAIILYNFETGARLSAGGGDAYQVPVTVR